jgi:Ca2+-transporting ATPase
VQQCRAAGIQVVMITGDRQETADAVARDIQLKDGKQTRSITSAQLNQLSDAEIKRMLPELGMFSLSLSLCVCIWCD